MTILMGLFSNRPLACASGMGVNAVVAFSLTPITGGDWHASMAVIFIEGIAILLLVLCGLREAIMDAIPVNLRHAISVGLGLFIAMIGLKNSGIIVANESTLVELFFTLLVLRAPCLSASSLPYLLVFHLVLPQALQALFLVLISPLLVHHS